ncbi:MAG TPA: DnaD domain protein [Lachnospiraceae bacterium]|nr:DnaD domain protein [Lachnospiraceae bacterium]
MNQLHIYQDNCADFTVISNRFIDEYMIEANDAQLKVYLYLVRLLSAHLSTSVSDIADKFNHTEKDVIRALKYWEKNKLLSLDYDEAKLLCGIHLRDTFLSCQKTNVEVITPSIATEISSPATSVVLAASNYSSVTSIVATPSMEKPNYTLDQIKAFKNNEDTEQLLFIAEQYIGKPLSPSDIKTILFIFDHLGFSIDLIDYLIQYCVDRGKKEFRYIEKVALSWSEDHISTVKAANSYVEKYDKTTYTIMKSLGKSATPTTKEIDFMKRWTNELGFTLDIIVEACNKTVMSTDKHRFEYADGILGNWSKQNVRHKSDITALDEKFRISKTANTGSSSNSNNKFNQFSQNAYNFSELEKELLSN